MNSLPFFDLSGKIAIVTGGSSGLGKSIGQGLADAGCNVVICSRNYDACRRAAEDFSQSHVEVLAERCDVTRSDEIDRLVRLTTERMGGIDILVNNAGIEGEEMPVGETSEAAWDAIIDANLKGTFLFCRAVIEPMKRRGGGKIINVASIAGMVGMANVAAYCASKGGVIQFTKALALELASVNIQVNALCPGVFDTPMSQRLYAAETWQEIVRRKVPAKRQGTPDELKGTAVYLASAASNFMTGASVVIDGGQSVW